MYDLIIIGAGPAGMTAGIYAARKKLRTLIISKDIGGQTAWSSDVENYPGFTMLKGADLVQKFEHHLEQFKETVELRLTTKGVTGITKDNDNFLVTMGDGKTEHTRAIILAAGKVPKKLGVKGENEFLNKGVTYCAWCDGPLFAGKDVAIIGGGNSALDAALNVSKLVKTIYVINNADALTADQALVDKAHEVINIRVMNNCELLEIKGEDLVQSVVVLDHNSGLNKDVTVEGVFVEVGATPATEWLKDFILLDEMNEIVVDKYNMTNMSGIFAAGDATNVIEKQIVVAAGEGAKAAICASQYLARKPA